MTTPAVAEQPRDTRNLSMPEAAQRIGCSRRKLERHVALGQVRVLRFGRRVVVPADEVTRVAAAGLPVLPKSAAK